MRKSNKHRNTGIDILEARHFLSGVSFIPQNVIASDADWPASLFAGDLDLDGDADLLSASAGDDKIAWYENMDGEGDFGPPQLISLKADGAQFVTATDVDGDGDLDVLSPTPYDGMISWYENTDGKGTFGGS